MTGWGAALDLASETPLLQGETQRLLREIAELGSPDLILGGSIFRS